jgi:hypothetical protein
MQEILEGCGGYADTMYCKDNDKVVHIKCGNKEVDAYHTGKWKDKYLRKILCPLCKKAKEERIKCIKEELEFLEGIKNFIMTCEMEKEYTLTDINKFINRISFLKSELKLGEENVPKHKD